MNYFPSVDRWLLPATILSASIKEMAADGRHNCEGTCFWLGQRANSEARITHLALLRGHGAQKSAFNVTVSAELMRALHTKAAALDLILLAQIHSHAAECGVDMSPTDHACGITVPFFLSVICPNFAQDPATSIQDCGVHVCQPGNGYVRLTRAEIAQRICLLPGLRHLTLIAGD
jgi:hypothetical protein